MAIDDPGAQETTWTEWPASSRAALQEMTADFMATWRVRDFELRGRPVPGDDMGGSQPWAGSSSYSEAFGTSRIYLPPWARVLVAVMNARVDLADPLNNFGGGIFRFFLRVGSEASTISSVHLQCNIGLSGGQPFCNGVANFADDTPEGGDLVWYRKRVLFVIPEAMWDSEQEIAWNIQLSSDEIVQADLVNDGSLGQPINSWYFVNPDPDAPE